MSCGSGYWAIPGDLHALLFGIIYPAFSVICIVVLARTIRRRRQGRYALSQKQMDSQTSKLEKHGLEEQTSDLSRVALPLPSACDILQPLSHLTPLPPSGHLVSMLGCEPVRIKVASEDPGVMSDWNISHRDNNRPATSDTDDSHVGPFVASQFQGGLAEQQQIEPPAVPATCSTENHGGEVFELPGSDEPPTIQRRNQTVQFPQVADADGTRSWKRLIMEYN